MKPKNELPSSLARLVAAIEAEGRLTPAKLRKLILDAQVQEQDLMPWADYDHPAADSYGRKLVWHGGHFEIMVMAWAPGDYSAIHDHGSTQWGAVQIFGPAEHAVFQVSDGQIGTLGRARVQPGLVVCVGHELVHQMGNTHPTERFLSLHVYGDRGSNDNITGDARLFDLSEGSIQRTDGGVFFALPESQVKRREPGFQPDFLTWSRHQVELARRLRRMEAAGLPHERLRSAEVVGQLFAPAHRDWLLADLAEQVDAHGHFSSSVYGKTLRWELGEAAALYAELSGRRGADDAFHTYARIYDHVIGEPCLRDFMASYLRFFLDRAGLDLPRTSWLSIGCGTGLVEEHLIRAMGANRSLLLGIDLSEAMVREARGRIAAEVGDVLELDPERGLWDVTYCGLNVFQYLDKEHLEPAIARTAAVTREGGHFVGDFITPDHIRWYPNLIVSEDRQVLSLRYPRLVERGNCSFQESEILNVSFLDGDMRVTHEGVHARFLPPMARVRLYFERHFRQVEIFDALSLAPIPDSADTCPSTRYVVIARK